MDTVGTVSFDLSCEMCLFATPFPRTQNSHHERNGTWVFICASISSWLGSSQGLFPLAILPSSASSKHGWHTKSLSGTFSELPDGTITFESTFESTPSIFGLMEIMFRVLVHSLDRVGTSRFTVPAPQKGWNSRRHHCPPRPRPRIGCP